MTKQPKKLFGFFSWEFRRLPSKNWAIEIRKNTPKEADRTVRRSGSQMKGSLKRFIKKVFRVFGLQVEGIWGTDVGIIIRTAEKPRKQNRAPLETQKTTKAKAGPMTLAIDPAVSPAVKRALKKAAKKAKKNHKKPAVTNTGASQAESDALKRLEQINRRLTIEKLYWQDRAIEAETSKSPQKTRTSS